MITLSPAPGRLFAQFVFLLVFTVAGSNAGLAQGRDESGAAHVRDSDPLSPEEQLQTFRLPPGFTINLFAAEPDIGKPINMAFDSAGRLWVTQSSEYPFAAEPGKGRDRLTVLEDTNGDGRADSVIHFADDLNIPIGLHPLGDGAIAYSIPSVLRIYDSNSDLRADRRDPLIGPFGFADTHGMVNNLIRGFDGWIHACHGFHNVSTVSAQDGRKVTMRSGNTFRFPTDGSRMEVTTTGRVNPFGQAYDNWGYLYSSDCHSTPIYQLIRGADYPTFHLGPTGIGYGPRMMAHTHGPTAISGLAFYTADNFPPEFRENFYAGNVVSNRVKRDSLKWHGSTPVAVQEGDFLVGDDPWFRPVDVKVGPDGALYVADFYNRIIGHYEVPLDHPGRDSHRGRIWRIAYQGTDGESQPAAKPNLHPASLEKLIETLAHPNLSLRFRAADEITDRVGIRAVGPLLSSWSDDSSPAPRKVMTIWILQRLNALPSSILREAATSPEEIIRVHAMRILTEDGASEDLRRALARNALTDESPHVRRAGAEALARVPDPDHIAPLLALFHGTPEPDTHLRYTVRQSLRDTLRHESALVSVLDREWDAADAAVLADVLTGVDHPHAAAFLLAYLPKHDEPPATTQRYLRHAALHVPESDLATFARIGRDVAAGNPALEMELFEIMFAAARQRGISLAPATRAWGEEIALRSTGYSPATGGWRYQRSSPSDQSGDPWAVNPIPSNDGQILPFLSSRPIDETFTGILRSPEFRLPKHLTFYLAGHAGFPDREAHRENLARLRTAETGTVLRESYPPRNDTAVMVTWNLEDHEGELAFFELIDGDPAHAYAWIAAGRFDPPVIETPRLGTGEHNVHRSRGIRIAAELRTETLLPNLERIVLDPNESVSVRVESIEALANISTAISVSPLVAILSDPEQPSGLLDAAAVILARADSKETETLLAETIARVPHEVKVAIAAELAATTVGRSRLLALTANGALPAPLLLEPVVEERLLAGLDDAGTKRYERLVAGIPPVDVRLQERINQVRQSFQSGLARPDLGRNLFAVHCTACHQTGGGGGLVGPQLDGIGNWGAARLIEKIIAPNRNVSPSFRYRTVSLEDGRTFTGLFQREEGATAVFTDAAGRETVLSKSEILEQRESPYSLMPAVFGEILSEEEIHNLVAYLLTLE